MATSQQQHWLITVAHRAGLEHLDHVSIPLDTPPAHAWEMAAAGLDVSQEELAAHIASAFRMKVADLENIEPAASRLLPEADAQRLLVLPLRATDRMLVVATSDPLDIDTEKEIAFASGRSVEFEIAPPAPLRHAVNHAYSSGESDDFVVTNEALAEASRYVKFLDEPETAQEQDEGGKAWAMVELTSLILYEAEKTEAELVMIGPMESGGRVRFQIDGEFHTFLRVPLQTLSLITSRLKVLGGIEEIEGGESLETQKGEIHARIQDLDYVIRISCTREGDADDMVLWLTEGSAPTDKAESVPSPVPPTVAPTADEAPSTPLALVVDDEPPDLLIMRAVMERLGFRVVEATTGEEAVEHLAGHEDFTVMLLDLKMPGMDGLEVLTHVRTTLKTAALPVIIMTGSDDPGDENRLLARGANDYIKKPIDPPWAVTRVQSVLQRAKS